MITPGLFINDWTPRTTNSPVAVPTPDSLLKHPGLYIAHLFVKPHHEILPTTHVKNLAR